MTSHDQLTSQGRDDGLAGGGHDDVVGDRYGRRRARGPRNNVWPWALAGIAAGAVAVGVGQLVAVVTGPDSAPLIAVAQTFIDHTPLWLKEFATTTFGTADKTVLLGGAAAVVLALSALIGVLARRARGPAMIGVLVLGAVGVGAAITRPDATMLSAAPGAVGAVAGAIVLGLLRSRGLPEGPHRPDVARRDLLRASGVALAGGVVAGVAGDVLGAAARGTDASRAAVRLPAPVSPDVLPAGVEVGVPGVVPFRVANGDFYRIDTATVVPRLTTGGWRLKIHGMVERELQLDWATLLTSPLVERDLTLICVSNEVGGDLTGNARWLGLPVGPLLKRAGPSADADMVLSTSADGWTASTPLEVLTDGRDALLAVAMNGQPLPVEHGFPVRMVVPGLYGYVSATKWVVDLEVTRFDRAEGYWTSRGWSARGPVKTESRIDVPQDGATVKAGTVAVAGIAWAQHQGIRAVQVQVDGGTWQSAQLASEDTIDTWRQWVFRWNATPGNHKIAVRATDKTGYVQTSMQADPAPDGASGWHTIGVSVN